MDSQIYFRGDANAFPAEARDTIEDMVGGKLVYVADEASTPVGLHEAFMKLAGPYGMSIVANNDALAWISTEGN